MNSSASEISKKLSEYNFESISSSDCARALRALLEWLRESSFYSRQQQPLSTLRFQRLYRELESDLDSKKKIHILLLSTLQSFDISSLLTQTGLSRPHGFVQEFFSRAVGRVLPKHSPRPNFMDLLYFLFPVKTDADFFQKLPRDVYERLLVLFDPELKSAEEGQKVLSSHFHGEILDALLILSAQCLVLSESALINDIRWTIRVPKKERNSFMHLHEFINKVVHDKTRRTQENEENFTGVLQRCRLELSDIHAHLEQSSLSVDLVYQLEVLQLLLDRIRALLFIFIFSEKAGTKSLDFFASLISEEQRRRSIRVLINQNVHYLARKIVDNAGETGDHYIARNAHETKELFKAALGGGFVTGFTVLLKILIYQASFPMFFQGFFTTINYAGSFISMQFMHLTLATKQPAMTAAALAKKMTGLSSELKELRHEMKSLLKSQTLAAVGNLCAVIPTSFCLFLVWQLIFETPILSVEEANSMLSAHHPFKSLTFFYAMLTGIVLWTSSLVHGWVENWMFFRGIPELLSESFLLENFLSREKRLRLSKWLRKNLAGITANLALGFLLAFIPIIGSFFGLPLDVRHVTLATGGLTLAFASLPTGDITPAMISFTAFGIVLILLGNLLVSFFLSLWLALRAKGWNLSDVKDVLKTLFSKEV